MIIDFQDRKFREECNNFKVLKKNQGEPRAKKIRRRLDDLTAVNSLEEMKSLPGDCHELKGNRRGQISLDLDGQWRLIFVPADLPPAVKSDGGIDWQRVHVIKILGIEDTHE